MTGTFTVGTSTVTIPCAVVCPEHKRGCEMNAGHADLLHLHGGTENGRAVSAAGHGFFCRFTEIGVVAYGFSD